MGYFSGPLKPCGRRGRRSGWWRQLIQRLLKEGGSWEPVDSESPLRGDNDNDDEGCSRRQERPSYQCLFLGSPAAQRMWILCKGSASGHDIARHPMPALNMAAGKDSQPSRQAERATHHLGCCYGTCYKLPQWGHIANTMVPELVLSHRDGNI